MTAPAPGTPTYDVVWPRSPVGVQSRTPAPRLASLTGRRIAFVWDYMFRGEEIFPIVERELRREFADVEIVGYDAVGNIHGADEKARVAQLPHVLANHRVDAVICGNGC